MRVEITDQDALGAIKPEAVARYLQANGWNELRRVEDELIVLGKPDAQGKIQPVWMPISNEYTDYVPMLARLFKTVAEVEDKSELQLLDDLETVAVGDIIRVRTLNPLDEHDHTLPLSDGLDLLTSTRSMARAAAASAVETRPVHPRRPTLEVTQFVNDLQLAQSERSSYVIRLVAPILELPERQEGQLEGMPDEQPFSRRATTELVRSLNALKEAAEDNRSRGRFFFNTFVEAVPSGVSANLCEAVTLPRDEGEFARPIEVSVTWSYAISRTDTLPTEAVRIDSSITPFIREAAREFRAKNPEVVTLRGWVHILERGTKDVGPGHVRIYARVDRSARAIRMELDKERYELAIDAHRKGSLVEVTGTLTVERGYYYRLENITGFRVVEQLGLFDHDEDDFQ